MEDVVQDAAHTGQSARRFPTVESGA
jgi:hypothetical protein